MNDDDRSRPAAAAPEVLPALQVRAGAIVALRLFDVAYSIDLTQVERLWAQRQGGASSRSRLSATPAKAVAFDVPPVRLFLDSVELHIDHTELVAAATARLYDFGVVALALRIPVANLDWDAYTQLCNAAATSIGAQMWDELLRRVLEPLVPALERRGACTLQEDYLLALVQEWSEPLKAAELERRIDLAPLLSGEKRPLSEGARRELLRQRFSYYEDDLVALTWDRAFIVEPRGDSDVADVNEVANAQLLEQRYYDELLDDELPRMYDMVEQTRRARSLFAPRRFGDLARRLYTLVAEVTELTEKVDNALQVTEDVYLARIYSAALELFRVPKLGAAVDRKLAIIRDTYTALYDEASGLRGELMELAIVILIVIELVVALLQQH
ncbi:MAG: hypothetical protein P4L83_21275 [Nevskia sp.]|nr:hypothetical protein [Nevskia sp.]